MKRKDNFKIDFRSMDSIHLRHRTIQHLEGFTQIGKKYFFRTELLAAKFKCVNFAFNDLKM